MVTVTVRGNNPRFRVLGVGPERLMHGLGAKDLRVETSGVQD